jgi:type I restriction enzyme S subunit
MSSEIPDGWKEEKLGDFAGLKYGKNLPADTREAGAAPVFSSAGEIDSHIEALTDGPGVIVGRKGSVGSVYFSPVPFWPIDTTFFVLDDPTRDLRFTFWLFRGLEKRLQGMNSDSAVPGLNREEAEHLPILVPPLPEQRRIAWVLGTLDDKIELNRKMASLPEETAAAIFKARFVDFEGVKEFEDSEIGPIPKGAAVGSLSDLCSFSYGKAMPASKRNGGPVAVIGSSGVTGWHDRALFSAPGIVIGRKGTAGSVHWIDDDFFPIDTTFVCEPKEKVPLVFLYLALLQLDLPNLTVNSGVPGLNRDEALGSRMIIPETSDLEAFEEIVAPLFASRTLLLEMSRSLSALRDELLPKLISGAIRVPEGVGPDTDADAVVEELVEA